VGGLVLLPARDPDVPNDCVLFVAHDNEFLTTNGFHAGEAYVGTFDNHTMFLAWRVKTAPVPEPASALLMAGGAALLLARWRRRGWGGAHWNALLPAPGCVLALLLIDAGVGLDDDRRRVSRRQRETQRMTLAAPG
jgi:hypothetical protein